MKTYVALTSMAPLGTLWLLSGIGLTLLLWEARKSPKLLAGAVVAIALAVVIVKPLVPIDPYCFGMPEWLCYLLP